jgi:iron complex outermembrane receptor protein
MGGDVRLPSDRGLISASVGLEHHRSHTHDENVHGYSSLAPDTVSTKTLFSVRGGARFDLGPGILFKANVGRSYRSPSFFELFGDRGGVFGNTDLVPELAVTWDAGMRITSRGVVLEAGTFDHRYRDLIQFIQNSQAVSRPTNIGNARVRGLETTLGLQLTRWTAVSGNYTYQRTRDESKAGFQRGKALPNRPTHEAYGSLALLPGRWRFSYEYTYQAGNYRDRANLRRVPARHVHNVAVRRRIYNDVAVTAEAKNLLGSQIADLWGYPLPGRSVFVTVQDSY